MERKHIPQQTPTREVYCAVCGPPTAYPCAVAVAEVSAEVRRTRARVAQLQRDGVVPLNYDTFPGGGPPIELIAAEVRALGEDARIVEGLLFVSRSLPPTIAEKAVRRAAQRIQ